MSSQPPKAQIAAEVNAQTQQLRQDANSSLQQLLQQQQRKLHDMVAALKAPQASVNSNDAEPISAEQLTAMTEPAHANLAAIHGQNQVQLDAIMARINASLAAPSPQDNIAEPASAAASDSAEDANTTGEANDTTTSSKASAV